MQARAFAIKFFDDSHRDFAKFTVLHCFGMMGVAVADECFQTDCAIGTHQSDNPLRSISQIMRQFDQATAQGEQ